MRLGKWSKQIAVFDSKKPVHDKIENSCCEGSQEYGHDHNAGDKGLVIIYLSVQVYISQVYHIRPLPYCNILGIKETNSAANITPQRIRCYTICVVKIQ